MAHVLQDRFSQEIDRVLRAKLVVNGIVNHRFEGNPKAGAVKIPYHNIMEAGTYSKTTGKALTYGDTAYVTLDLVDVAVNELCDGFEALAVSDKMIANKIEDAGYALALKSEKLAIAELEANATAVGTTASTAATIYGNIVDAGVALDNAKVPAEGRAIVVSPAVYAMLLKSDDFIKRGDLSQEMINKGAIGEIAGFAVYKCLNLGVKTEFIALHPDWFAEVNEWSVPAGIYDLADGVHIGSSAFQGRKVVGYKLTQATAAYMKKNAA